MSKLLTIPVLFFFLQQSKAADVKFLFYHINNDVSWQHDGLKEKAKRGMYLSANQSILISELSDVMLVQSDGKSMLLNKPGLYTFQKIKQMFSLIKTSGVSEGFFSYVFERFLNGGSSNDQQKVSAAVIRGRYAMLLPADSSFLFTASVLLQWKPEQKNMPYRVTVRTNHTVFDTVIRQKTVLTIPSGFLRGNEAKLIEWVATPSDSKLQRPHFFVYIIPAKKDKVILQHQLHLLKSGYGNDPQLFQLMKKDLFEHWLEIYQFH